MERWEGERVAFSLPSLRVDTLSPKMIDQIKRVRKTGFTLAPEAGTQRLRDVINKNISEADILNTVQAVFKAGWRVLKLYFMIGLPTETREDLQGLVDLVKKIQKAARSVNPRLQINVGISTFIPKPHTPFQWTAQLTTGREPGTNCLYSKGPAGQDHPGEMERSPSKPFGGIVFPWRSTPGTDDRAGLSKRSPFGCLE